MMTLEELNNDIELITLSAIRTGTPPEVIASMFIQQANKIQASLPIVQAMRDCNVTGGGLDL